MTRSSHRKKSKHVALLSVLGVLLVLISFYTYRSTILHKAFFAEYRNKWNKCQQSNSRKSK